MTNKMLARCTLLSVLFTVPCAVHGWFEFGRSDPSPRKHLWQRKRNVGLEHVGGAEWRKDLNRLEKSEMMDEILKQFEEVLDVGGGVTRFSMSMSMSMPMSMPIYARPPSRATEAPGSNDVSPAPSPGPLNTSDQPDNGSTGTPTQATNPAPPSAGTGSPTPTPTQPTAISAEPPSLPTSDVVTPTPVPGGSATLVPTPTKSPAPSLAPTPNPTSPQSGTMSPTPEPSEDGGFVDNNNNGSTNTTLAPTRPSQVFDCIGGGLLLGAATDEATTEIFLTVGYEAESSSNDTEAFREALERELLETAVVAALGGTCLEGTGTTANGTRVRQLVRRSLLSEPASQPFSRKLLSISTAEIASCEALLNETESCTVLETDLHFILNGAVDRDVATYNAYTAIAEGMDGDDYVGRVPTILLLEYLSPMPLQAPPSQVNGSETSLEPPLQISSTAADRLAVSPWTIGACVATLAGGVISLLVWSRNRHARQRRHVQMLEEQSMMGLSTGRRRDARF